MLVGPLVDGDRVAGPGQLLGGGQAGRPAADDGDRLAGEPLRRLRLHLPVVERPVDDRDLDLLDRHRGWLMPSTHAVSHGAGQSRPVNSGKLFVACSRSIASSQSSRQARSFHSGIRLPSGQPLVAERDPAVHAAAGLRAGAACRVLLLVDLVPVHAAGPATGRRGGSSRSRVCRKPWGSATGGLHDPAPHLGAVGVEPSASACGPHVEDALVVAGQDPGEAACGRGPSPRAARPATAESVHSRCSTSRSCTTFSSLVAQRRRGRPARC